MNKKSEQTIRYQAEWCSKCPLDECGDADLDRAEYKRQSFDHLYLTVAFAVALLRERKDFFGSIEIEEQELRLDDDILEHEGRHVLKWHPLRVLHVDDLEYKYSEKDLETIER